MAPDWVAEDVPRHERDDGAHCQEVPIWRLIPHAMEGPFPSEGRTMPILTSGRAHPYPARRAF
jgi:hypothetical protein